MIVAFLKEEFERRILLYCGLVPNRTTPKSQYPCLAHVISMSTRGNQHTYHFYYVRNGCLDTFLA
jgi:hypothetical protein